MKTIKFTRGNSETITVRIPMDELVAAFFTPEERAAVEGFKVDAYSTKSDENSEDEREDVVDFSFSKYRTAVRNEAGEYVEEPKEAGGGCCLTKKAAEKMIEASVEAALSKRPSP